MREPRGRLPTVDADTERLLEGLMRRWGVSRSEVIRRSVAIAAGSEAEVQLAALDELQAGLGLGIAAVRRWQARVRSDRRAPRRRTAR